MTGRVPTPRRKRPAGWILPLGLVLVGAGLLVLSVSDRAAAGEAWWLPLAGALGTGLIAGGSFYVLRQRRSGSGAMPRWVHVSLGLGVVLLVAVLIYLYAF